MALPEHFRFSQNNLQDYTECPRRFELKYLLRQEWPAVVSEPILIFELHQQLGRQFHTLVQRHLSGIPINILEKSLTDPLLAVWWKNYLEFIQRYASDSCIAEIATTIPFDQYHLTARFDCLIYGADHSILIVDWKTTRFRTPSHALKNRLQSLIYPYVLFEANQKSFSADQIQLIFWFPEFPDRPEPFIYSQEQYTENDIHLRSLIGEIKATKPGKFSLTENEKHCQFCIYRSLCSRGTKAGSQTDGDSDLEELYSEVAKLDFNAIEEIQF